MRVLKHPYHPLLVIHGNDGGHAAGHDHARVAVLPAVLPPHQYAAHRLEAPLAAALGAVRLPGAHHVGHRLARQDHAHAQADGGGLLLVDHVAPVHYVPAVAHAAVGHAPLGVLLYAVAYALAVERALVLRQHLQHAQLQHARRAVRNVLARVQYLDAAAAQHDARHGHLVAVAHDSGNFIYDHEIEQPSLGVSHHALELGAVGVGARLREVAVRGHHAQVVLGAVGAGLLHLYLYGLAALVVAREAGVYRRAPAHGYSISSAAWNHTTVPITRTGPSSMPKIMSS